VRRFQPESDPCASSEGIGTTPNGRLIFNVGSAALEMEGNRVAVVRGSADQGAHWAILDAYSEPGWPSATYYAFAADASGGLYAGGCLFNPERLEMAWIVRESHDGGATWVTSDAFQDRAGARANCADIKVAPAGDVYAAGISDQNWIVRRKDCGAPNFVTVDSLPMATGRGYRTDTARAIAFHSTAGVFVVGGMPWTVRRSADGGRTWKTADSFQNGSWRASSAEDIAADSSGTIYVAGFAQYFNRITGTSYWMVRRSTDGGLTWKTVDLFAYGNGAYAQGLAIDALGRIIVCGYAQTDQGDHWLVRRGTPGAKGAISWATSDDFQLVDGQSAQARDMAKDAQGNLFVTGQAVDAAGVDHWLVRRLGRYSLWKW
jgi:hypothetical protein